MCTLVLFPVCTTSFSVQIVSVPVWNLLVFEYTDALGSPHL